MDKGKGKCHPIIDDAIHAIQSMVKGITAEEIMDAIDDASVSENGQSLVLKFRPGVLHRNASLSEAMQELLGSRG